MLGLLILNSLEKTLQPGPDDVFLLDQFLDHGIIRSFLFLHFPDREAQSGQFLLLRFDSCQ
jgi:hypothetical protein